MSQHESHGVGQVVQGHVGGLLPDFGRSRTVPVLLESQAVIDGEDLYSNVCQIVETASAAAVGEAAAEHIYHGRSFPLRHFCRIVQPVQAKGVSPLDGILVSLLDRLAEGEAGGKCQAQGQDDGLFHAV